MIFLREKIIVITGKKEWKKNSSGPMSGHSDAIPEKKREKKSLISSPAKLNSTQVTKYSPDSHKNSRKDGDANSAQKCLFTVQTFIKGQLLVLCPFRS